MTTQPSFTFPLPPAQMIDFTSTTVLAILFLSSILLLSAFLTPAPLLRWLQRKRYQYEVTYSLYMLTPTEQFVFNSFLFLFLSMIVIAASLYLPEHIMTIAHRVFYYLAGEDGIHTVADTAASITEMVKESMGTAVMGASKQTAGAVAGLAGNGRAMMDA